MKRQLIGIFIMTLLIATIVPVMQATDSPSDANNKTVDGTSLTACEKTSETSSLMSVSAEVYTNKFVYHKGETVDYTLLNKGDTWITVGGPPMGEILRFYFMGFQWTRIYPDSWHMMIRYIGPGTSYTEEWDQTDLDGNQVPMGIYRVDAWYTESTPPPYSTKVSMQLTASDYFIIIP